MHKKASSKYYKLGKFSKKHYYFSRSFRNNKDTTLINVLIHEMQTDCSVFEAEKGLVFFLYLERKRIMWKINSTYLLFISNKMWFLCSIGPVMGNKFKFLNHHFYTFPFGKFVESLNKLFQVKVPYTSLYRVLDTHASRQIESIRTKSSPKSSCCLYQ